MSNKQIFYRYIVRDKGEDNGLAASMIIDIDMDLEYSLYEEGEKLPLPDIEFPAEAKFYFTALGKEEFEHLAQLWAYNVLLQKREGIFTDSMQIVLLTVAVDNSIPCYYADEFQLAINEEEVSVILENILNLEEIWNIFYEDSSTDF